MTVSQSAMLSGPYISNGSNRAWSFAFKVKDASHLQIIVADDALGRNAVSYTSNYSVDPVALDRDQGGIVTFPLSGAPIAFNKWVWIASRVPYLQGSTFSRQGAYNPVQVMYALDDLSIQIKQVALDTARAPKFNYGSTVPKIVEPPVAGRTIVYDSNGNFINGLGTAEISAGIAAANAAAASASASANLALGYKNAVQLLADTIFDATNLSDSLLPKVVNFVGNGVATSFSDAALIGRDERAVDVYFSGVRQQNNTYTVTGGSVVFDEAPPNGITIEVKVQSSISISYDISVPPDGVTYLEILPALPSSGNFEGRFVYRTSDDLLYTYDGTVWKAITSSEGGGGGGGGTLPDDATFISILDALPASGNFEGRYVHYTVDGKLYSFSAGDWKTVGGAGGNTPNGLTYIEVVYDLPIADNTESRAVYLRSDGKIYVYVDGDWTATTGGGGGGGPGPLPDDAVFIEIVDVLPSVGNFEGRVVYLTTDGKLYTYTDGGWKTVVDGSDVNFPDGFTGIQIVGALPVTDNFAGRVVYLNTDGKLYRFDGSQWLRSTAAADIAGQITTTQIADDAISTPKLAAGAVTAAKITAGAVTADAIQAGAINAAKIAAGSITSDKIGTGAVTADKILAGSVTAAKVSITNLQALSAQLGAVNISSAIMGSLQVNTINLAGNAVTVQAGAETAGAITVNATWTQIQGVTVSWGSTASIWVFCQFKHPNLSPEELEIDIRSGGTSLFSSPKSFVPNARNFNHYLDLFPSGVVSGAGITFWLRRTASGSTTINNRKILVLAAKR